MLSTGQIAAAGQAIAWRGPMAGKALEQLIDARWGDIDTLVVDLPPGTGDVQLTMIQRHKPAGAVIVSTPRSEEHTSELQSLMRLSYAVFCLKKKNRKNS